MALELAEDYWQWRLKDSPEFATCIGEHTYDDLVDKLTLNALKERIEKCRDVMRRLTNFDTSEDLNLTLLKHDLNTYLEGYKWRYHGLCNPISFLENVIVDWDSYLLDATEFKTLSDLQMYRRRLVALSKQVRSQIELLRVAMERGTTLHSLSVAPCITKLETFLEKGPQNSRFYTICVENLETRAGISASEKEVLEKQITTVITENLFDACSELFVFLKEAYLQNTRPSLGVSSLLDGVEFYQACLRWHLSDDVTPQAVHELGLTEVSRVRANVEACIEKAGFHGSIRQFVNHLSGSDFYHTSEDALLEEYRVIIQEKISPKLGELFSRFPDIPVEVSPMAYDGPGGQYIEASADGTRPGKFQVNLLKPETKPRYSMMALTLHEALPGHHLQHVYNSERCLPSFRTRRDYRRMYAVPLQFPTYTAYVEGWALYAEHLGEEMGLYENVYEQFGRYSEEMLRAARLVIDTGLHIFGWSREQAVCYLSSLTALPLEEIEVEVDRYITWPGQACAYKFGEMKIKQLRQRACQKLGDMFDIKSFHDVILRLGPVPLDILEAEIDKWLLVTRRQDKSCK